MKNIIQTFNLDINDLIISKQAIGKALGYKNRDIPETFSSMIDNLIAQTSENICVRAGFRLVLDGNVLAGDGYIKILGSVFKTGKIISRQLHKMNAAAIFTVTLGQKFDDWSKSLFSSGDPASGYIVDLIGSEFAESAADWVEKKIATFVTEFDYGCSRRCSPGYCGWDVMEQHKLFALLPTGFCGISLTDAALMLPIKSISGILGMGKDVVKNKFNCSNCSQQNCVSAQKVKETSKVSTECY